MRLISWLLSLPVFAAVIVFVLQNKTPVTVSFWPFDAALTLPLSVLALGLLIAGFLIGSLLTGVAQFRTQLEARRLRKELEKAKQEKASKTPLSCEPTILYNGRYQPVSTIQKASPVPKKKRWFGGSS